MPGSRLLWKVYAGYVALIFVTVAVVGGLVARKVEQNTREEILKSLNARAVLLREFAEPHLDKAVNRELLGRIRKLGSDTETRLTVIGMDGIVIADSLEDPRKMDNHGTRPEILAARSHGRGIAVRFSDTIGTDMMYLALVAERGGKRRGYVRVSLPLSKIDERLKELRMVVLFGASVAVFIALLLGFVVVRNYVGPIASLTSAAESIAAGNYDKRLPDLRRDEIGKLSRTFNTMAASLSERMETISRDKNKLQAILSGMVEGVVAVDPDEHIVHINESACVILGADPEKSVGMPVWEAVRIREVSEVLSESLKKNEEVKGMFRLVSHAQDRVVELHGSPFHDREGMLAGSVVVLHDISELRRLENMRREFVANASHELKTPITAIRGIIETLIGDKGMPEDKKESFLEKIRNQSERLSLLVADLLTLSQVESLESDITMSPVDLRSAVSGPAQNLVIAARERGVELEIDVPDRPFIVMGDIDLLGQVTTNLLDNAVKHTPKGGKVSVRLLQEGENAVIEVKDTGIGIEPGNQKRVFERFYTVDKARSRAVGGTGLGLSIVNHITLLHGGRIDLKSEPGGGSVFRASFPLK